MNAGTTDKFINTFMFSLNMVKTITITDEAYEKLKELKEKLGLSFSETILTKLSEQNTNFLELLEKYFGKLKFKIKDVKEVRRLWERRLS